MKDPLDVKLCDFDDVSYQVSVAPETPGVLTVSMNCACWDNLKALGIEEFIAPMYGQYIVPAVGEHNLTLQFDLNTPPANPGMLVFIYIVCCAKSFMLHIDE
jgi:hypothetical protein